MDISEILKHGLAVTIFLVLATSLVFAADSVEVNPENILELTNLEGTVEDIQDDPFDPEEPDRYLESQEDGEDTQILSDFEGPDRDLVEGEDQEFQVRVRRTDNSDRIPEVTINLLEDGTQIEELITDEDVIDPDGEVFTAIWDASQLEDLSGQNVEIEVEGTSTGGPDEDRNTVEVGAVRWNARVEERDDPIIELNSPDDDATFDYESDVVFDYNVTTLDEGANVTLFLNDDPVVEREQGIGEVNYQETVEELDAGEYTWYVEADGDNTFSESELRSFTVEEAEDPDINLTSPEEGEEFSYESNVSLEFDVETFDEPAEVELYVDPNSSSEELIQRYDQASDTSNSYVETLENLGNDTYEWRVEASNETTFSQNSSSFEVLEPEDPGINLMNPEDGETFEYGTDITFDYEVETIDEEAEVRLYLEDDIIKTSQQEKSVIESYSETVEDFEEGSYQWRVEAEGDLTFSDDSRTFEVEDPDTPDVNLTNPDDSEVFDYESDIEYKFDIETAEEEANISLVENDKEIFSATQEENTEQSYTYIVEDQDRGDYNWEVETTTDFHGTESSETRTYTIDDPEISINSSSPADGAQFSSDTREVELEWELETQIEGTTRIILNDTVEEEIDIETLNEELNLNSTVSVEDDEEYEWYADFESDEGDQEATELRTFSVEESDISEELIAPEDEEAFGNQDVGFEWEVDSDEDYYVELYVNDELESNQTGTAGNTTFTYEDEYEDGSYDWFIEINSDSGQVITSETREYVVDTEEPEFSEVRDDSGGNVLEGEPVNTSVFWESQEANLNKGYLFDNTSGYLTQTEEFDFESELTGHFNSSIDTSGLAGETVCWRQEADDESGNLNTSMRESCFDVVEELGVNTSEATNITFESAVLKGELKELNDFEEADVFFEYREIGRSDWERTSSDTLSTPDTFEDDLENLDSDTEYEFRAVAAYSNVESTGEILTFVTETQPDLILESPEDGLTVSPTVDFEFTPFCDSTCQEAELYFNTTERDDFNFVTDQKEEWDQGTFTNTSSIESIEGDFIRLEEVLKVFEEIADRIDILEGVIVEGNLEDTRTEDGETLDIQQDLDEGETKTETFVFEEESAQTFNVSNIDAIDVEIEGAGGGSGTGVNQLDGGSGGYINATMNVSDFKSIDIFVGEAGTDPAGGWGRFSGGDGGVSSAGGGGGSTEIIADDGTFLASSDAGGGAGDENDAQGQGDRGGGGGGAAGGLGGDGQDIDGEDAEERDGDGEGGDGGTDESAGEDGGQVINQELVDTSETTLGGGSGPNEDGEVRITYDEEDSASLDARFNFSTDAVNPEELRFESVASTTENLFNYTAYNFDSEEFEQLDKVESDSLEGNVVSLCNSGCDVEGDPESFVDADGNIITRFEAFDTEQDTLSIDFISVEVDSEEFERSGSYESKIFDAESEANWTESTIEQTVPSGTTSNIRYAENSSGSFEFYESIDDVPDSRYLKYLFEFEGDGDSTPEVESTNIEYERDIQKWEARENITDVSSGETNIISSNFTDQSLPNKFEWNIRVEDDEGDAFFADENRTVNVSETQVDLKTELIEIFDVTDVEDKRDSGEVIASGTNETFEIEQEDRQKKYRFSFTVENSGLEDWEIEEEDTLSHEGLNSTWEVVDSYYEIEGNVFEGSELEDRKLEWETVGGILESDTLLEANYIVETDTVTSNLYSMEFNAEMENSSTKDQHNLNKTKYGFLNISLNEPPETFTVQQNQTFEMNSSLVCREGKCGDVDTSVRYNESSVEPESLIPVDDSEEPFYIVGSSNTRDCGVLEKDNKCEEKWEINATGSLNTTRLVDSQAISSFSEVNAVNSKNSEVTIAEALILDIEWDSIDFGTIGPGEENVSAIGNEDEKFNVTVPSNSVDADRIEIRSEKLNNSVNDGYYIGASNMSYNLENDENLQKPLSEEYQILEENIDSGTTFPTYYWINVPTGIKADNYTGVIEFEASSE